MATVGQPTYVVNDPLHKDAVRVEYHEENDLFYTKERLAYIAWIKRLGFVAILAAIAQLVLSIIHVVNHASTFPIYLIVASAAFLIGGVITVVWSIGATKSFEARTEIFQPTRSNDRLTRFVFIFGLILAGAAAVVLVNLYMQSEYSPDYVRAQKYDENNWRIASYNGKTELSINRFFRANFIAQSIISGFFFFFFLLASRAAFRCLKYDNQAMSRLVFLGNLLLLIFGLCVIFFSEYAFGYGDYPHVRAQFPVWNIRGLNYLGMAVAAISIIGFLVDHRSWRVGFFVLSFLLLLVLVFLANFTGFAYRNTRHVYETYKGVSPRSTVDTCLNRMYDTHLNELERYGCQKYVEEGCTVEQRRQRWEPNTAEVVTVTPGGSATNTWQSLQFAADDTGLGFYCLNRNCCGLEGQLYSDTFLTLANFGLLATLAGCLVSVGCYYFWYVTWVDSNRDKKRDFIWLGLMALATIAFLVVFFVVDPALIRERLRENGEHY